jgi:prepilin-type N-terminal cleavage/methylation domain-containing protein
MNPARHTSPFTEALRRSLTSSKPVRADGFTLVEILIVVAVVGLLSLLAVVAISHIKARAAQSLIQNNLRQLYQAKVYYYTETGTAAPVSVNELAKQGYVKASTRDSLLNTHSFEANAGWHYVTTVVPDEPTTAYRGTTVPTSASSADDVIYYPGAPKDLSAYFAATGLSGGSSSPSQAPSIPPQTPAIGQPPAGSKAGSSPAAPWVLATPARLPAIREDSPRTFTQAELLKLIGSGTPNPQDLPQITGLTVNPRSGTVTKNSDGSWTFTPAPNFHGTDLDLAVKVANRAGENTAVARIDVTPVVDAPRPVVAVTGQQQVITFGESGTGAVMNQGTLATGGSMGYLAAEFTVIGGPQVATSGIHGATFLSYSTPSNPDEFYIWNPANLTVRVHGTEYPTGINTQADSASHRYTTLWDSSTGRLEVLRDGVVVKTINGVAQGYQIPGAGKLVLAQDQDSFGGGFAPQDAFHGQYLNAALARTPPDRTRLATSALGAAMQGQAGLIIDIGARAATFVDQTGHHQLQQQGAITATTQQVDTSVGAVRPGATLLLNVGAGAPRDRTDPVTGIVMSGLPTGTVLNDGQGHTHTVTGPSDMVNVMGWSTGTISAQLAGGSVGTHTVAVAVTTTGPTGATATATQATQVRVQ